MVDIKYVQFAINSCIRLKYHCLLTCMIILRYHSDYVQAFHIVSNVHIKYKVYVDIKWNSLEKD